MRTVYKYPVHLDDRTVVRGGSPRVVHVGVDPTGEPYQPCAWVELDPDGLDRTRLTYIGTGHEVPDGWSHVGSVVTPVGLVWHVYEEMADEAQTWLDPWGAAVDGGEVRP